VADVQGARNLFVGHHMPEFEDAGGGRERADPQRVEEIRRHAEEKLEDGWNARSAAFTAEPRPDQEDGESAQSYKQPVAGVQH
jgi:hypothetical protein